MRVLLLCDPAPLAAARARIGGLGEMSFVATPQAFLETLGRISIDLAILHRSAVGPGDLPCLMRSALAVKRTEDLPVALFGKWFSSDLRGLEGLGIEALVGDAQGRADVQTLCRSAVRRIRPQAVAETRQFGAMTLDEETFGLRARDGTMPLTRMDVTILGMMFDAPARIWSRDILQQAVFSPFDIPKSRALEAKISRLRRSAKDQLGIDPINLVRGAGYRLNPS
ncbi:winged helix-turn-helix domain-containing protein [Anianabacter salinae]|uniref:winged helix-turn-helix domain-containing protein n=1 Tax=Anianabacter salinae TaxID=2851023 RepID=UPI00225E50B0|nr:winged helix-turn-helix domain-containing protein [Anianabacter salinae]MBV0911818.1 winged helix-turn-helix domain-containing protein [Anianabacter salinae]